ncbi:hypothetical protein ASG49_18070 [Marmoricola sp. Leaf446]|nr:hypothetical protein ASG49_18070 [Marmoricola sp. Leaf446]
MARVLLALCFVGLAAAVLSPSNGLQDHVLRRIGEIAVARRLPFQLVAEQRLEIAANVAIVVPIGALGPLAFPRLRWQDWAAYAFIGAMGVELAQGLLLPDREMSATDVVANTLGATLGAVLVTVGLRAFRARRSG